MYKTIFTKEDMASYTGDPNAQKRQIGSIAGNSLKIMNFTKYGLGIYSGEELVDYLSPYQYIICANDPGYSLKLDQYASAEYQHPLSLVSVRGLQEAKSYEIGILIQVVVTAPGDVVNVAGNLTIANTPSVTIQGNVQATISNTPNVNISGIVNTSISSGNVNAVIQNASINSQVINAVNNPVPVDMGFYGDGTMGPLLATTGTQFINNVANSHFVGNYTSIYIAAGSEIRFANQAKYAILYSMGDIRIDGALWAPNGVTNIGDNPPLVVNGVTIKPGGNGGRGGYSRYGGVAPSYTYDGRFASWGGVGNCYTGGAGGGGSGGAGFSGSPDNAIGSYGRGYGAAPGGNGSSGGGTAGGAIPSYSTGTIILVALGNIYINGYVYSFGQPGGNGGNGVWGDLWPGGGGSSGPNKGGNAQTYRNPNANVSAGSGAGGCGGGSVMLWAGKTVYFAGSGAIVNHGGAGGAAGLNNMGDAFSTTGENGSAGNIAVYMAAGRIQG